jgi:acyl-CoA thioesterase I
MLSVVKSWVSLRLFGLAGWATLAGAGFSCGGAEADSLPQSKSDLSDFGWGGEQLAAPSRPTVAPRSYGRRRAGVQMPARMIALALFCGVLSAALSPAWSAENPVRIVALGDSLTAGFGLPAAAAFPVRLANALTADGVAVEISNAGVSGDTMSDGLARLDWSVPEGTQAVILELGANDMLRGIDPQVTRDALDAILARLAQRHISVLLCGMRAAPNLGADYGRTFERIYPELAAKHGVLLYPFFLDGVAAERTLTLPDGLHPNAAGVGVIVRGILPKAEELIARVRAQKQS